MARPVVGVARREQVLVRLTGRELAALDAHRGSVSRPDYLRRLLALAVAPAASRALLERGQGDSTGGSGTGRAITSGDR